MEYHAIEDAESWHAIRDILAERVKAGVEVRVFYDDMGSLGFINTDFVKRTQSYGINCRVFNPFVPGLNLFLNNRDHRKITVIDGKIGYTGGYNLANEYFHVTEPYGFGKDTGVRLARNGVRIFEFTPGFCHAKMSVSDDIIATCGTINLDYRSLYHHFENGCLYADCEAVMDTKHDFEKTFEQCREVTEYYTEGRGAIMRLEHMLLRLAAPLM